MRPQRAVLRRLAPAVLLATLTACSTVQSLNPFASAPSGPKMAELPPLKPAVQAAVAWRESVARAAVDYRFQPAVVGGSVYAAGSKGDVVRVDAGQTRWKVNLGTPLSAGVGSDGRMLAVATAKGEVIALDAENGKELWRARVSSEVLAPPALGEGLVVVRSVDSRLFAFDAADGKRRWVYQRQTPSLLVRSFAPPMIDGKYVFSGFPGGKLVAVTINNGAQAWEGTVAQPKGVTELDRVADITSPPVVAGRLICAVAFQGRVSCFDLGNGNLAWARDLSSAAGMAADARTVFVTDDKGAVHALDLASGASLWKQDKLFLRQVSGPAVAGRQVAVGDVQGFVHLLSREDGAFVGRVATDGSAIGTAPLVAGGNALVVQTAAGGLFAIEVQ